MNERIKKLYIQTANETADGKEWAIGGMNNAERFAELIVRECIDWCNAHARDDGTAQRIAEDIKKDFGVEE